jgi:cytochrome c553
MKKLFVFLIAFIATYVVIAQGDIEKGKEKAVACIACHGIDGNSPVDAFPKIAGQNAKYSLKQLLDIKSQARTSPIMLGIISSLNNEDLENLSAYFESQTISKGSAKKDANIDLGRSIYKAGKKGEMVSCMSCHGPSGKGIPSAGFPSLYSQHAKYTIQQLKYFRQTSINLKKGTNELSRSNDYEGMMVDVAKTLTDEEIQAVAEYIAGLN